MNQNFDHNENNYQETNPQEKNQKVIQEVPYKIEDVESERKASKKLPKTDFMKTMARGAAYAAIFGLVAGTSFTGLQYVSNIFQKTAESPVKEETKENEEQTEQTSGTDQVNDSLIPTGNVTNSSDVSEIAEQVMPSIVAIDCKVKNTITDFFGRTVQQEGSGSGTGIILKQDNEYLYIATNNHVVADSDSIQVTFHDTKTAAAVIKGTDANCDIAVIAVKLSDISSDTKLVIKTAVLGDSTALKVGQMSIAIGNALGYGQSVTVGYVSATGREVEMDSGTMKLIQTDAAINPGNSGGALVNSKGEVIGINSAKYASDEIEGMGFAIPISDAIPILDDLIEREEVTEADQGYLGITGKSVEKSYQEMYHMPEGVYIDSVEENSPAAKAGLKAGYIITKIKEKNIASTSDIQDIMTYTKGGTTVEVTYQTQIDGTYTEKTTKVTLGRKGDFVSDTTSENQSENRQNNQMPDQFYGSEQIPYGYGERGNFYGSYGNDHSNSEYQSGFPDGYLN